MPKAPGVEYPVLVPNMKGLERAIEAGVQSIAIFTAASETFNKRNINMSIDESFENYTPVALRARDEGIRARGYVSTGLGCAHRGHPRALIGLGRVRLSVRRGRAGGEGARSQRAAARSRLLRSVGGGHDRRRHADAGAGSDRRAAAG